MRTFGMVQLPVLLFTLLIGSKVCANDLCDFSSYKESSNRVGLLSSNVADWCYGGANDQSPLTKRVLALLSSLDKSATTQEALLRNQKKLLEALDLVKGSLETSAGNSPQSWRTYIAVTINELEEARAKIASSEGVAEHRHWQRSEDGFFEQPSTGTYLVPYGQDLMNACDASSWSPECEDALKQTIVLTRHIALVHRILEHPLQMRLRQLGNQLATLDEEWDYYLNEARSQFWWEFVLNGNRFDPDCEAANQRCVDVSFDSQSGEFLARPPSDQIIFMHPSVAMEYADGGPLVETSYNVAGIIEVLGYNRFRWGSSSGYSNWAIGASLIATWVPSGPGDDWGYGLMVHIKNDYSFGAVRRDTGFGTDTVFMFSIDLNKLFLSKSAEETKLFRSGM